MLRTQALHLALFAISALGKPFETAHKSVSQQWQRISDAANDHPIQLHISIPSPEQRLIEDRLLEISDPKSPKWRQHLTSEDVTGYLQPSEASVSAITEWLALMGHTPRRSYHALILETTVEQAEELLNTTYSVYKNAAGRKILRTHEYHLPQELYRHVEMIAPTVQFPHDSLRSDSKRQVRSRSTIIERRDAASSPTNASLESVCGPMNNIQAGPDCVKLLYSIDWTANNSNTTFAIFDPDVTTINNTDWQTYLADYGIDASNASVAEIHGPGWQVMAANGTSGEAQLDIEVSTGLTWPAVPSLIRTDTIGWDGDPTAFYNTSEYAEGQDFFLQFLHEMAYNTTVPPVVSISAGANEDWVPKSFAMRACNLIAASSARGVTWIASSGDYGPCNSQVRHNTTIDPQWPATCPWVLAVGATADPYDEVAATDLTSDFFTGGGFSNYFARPAYQDAVVPPYINSSVTPGFAAQDGFNASGRGYPDVAAIGAKVPVVKNGESQLTGGTSASAPLWAGIITLLNDYEASRGRPTLGFVNQWLYSLPPGQGLRDIVSCNGSVLAAPLGEMSPVPQQGYNGSVGWDACTGLGVPMFDVLRASLS